MSDRLSPSEMARIHARAFTQSRPWSESEFASLLTSPLTHVVGDTRCFALIRVIAGEAELLTIATDPDFQRQGLGRQAMQAWQHLARIHSATEAFLEVAADNPAAIALYLAEGFAPCGNRTGYYSRKNATSVDAIVMRKSLP